MRIVQGRLDYVTLLGFLRIEDSGLGIKRLGGETQPFGQGLENHATRSAQAALNLAEVGIGDAAHVSELPNRELGQLTLAADEFTKVSVRIGFFAGHIRCANSIRSLLQAVCA